MLIFAGDRLPGYRELNVSQLKIQYTQNFEERMRCRPGSLDCDFDRWRQRCYTGKVHRYCIREVS